MSKKYEIWKDHTNDEFIIINKHIKWFKDPRFGWVEWAFNDDYVDHPKYNNEVTWTYVRDLTPAEIIAWCF